MCNLLNNVTDIGLEFGVVCIIMKHRLVGLMSVVLFELAKGA